MKALFAVLLAASVPASAQLAPRARIGAMLEGSPAEFGAAVPPLSSLPAPETPPAADAPAPELPTVVPAGLYETLKAPDATTLNWLSSRIPGLDAGQVRVLTLAGADAIFSAAADRSESPLDLFTDPEFRSARVYLITQADIQTIFTRYEIHVLTAPSGKSKDGKAFAMQALLLGGGRVEALYDRDGFDFDNPMFPGHSYKASARVSQRIQGPGDALVEGVWVHAGPFTPRITRVVKLSATQGRVETSMGSRNAPVTPIRRR